MRTAGKLLAAAAPDQSSGGDVGRPPHRRGLGFHQRIRAQRQAVAAIQRVRGIVYYEWDFRDGRPLPTGTVPPWPAGLGAVFGPDFFGCPVGVWLGNGGNLANDALMAEVGQLRRLEYLLISNASITDAGLAALRRLTNLKKLRLCTNTVSGAGLAHVEWMTELEELELPYAAVSDVDLWRTSRQ